MSEKLSTAYNVFNPDALRKASEGVGMYAGGLSLALLGVGPETLDKKIQQPLIPVQQTDERLEGADVTQLEELSRIVAMKRLAAALSIRGAVYPPVPAEYTRR